MADARGKKVLPILQDLYSESTYAVDVGCTSLREPLGLGDVIEVADIASLTVNASGSVTASPEAVTTSVLSLNANLEPWINAALPKMASIQLLDSGNWAEQVSRQSVLMLKNSLDENLFAYLQENNFSTSAAYHTNVSGDSLTAGDLATAIATLTDNRGVSVESLALFVSAWGRASIQSISSFIPNGSEAERGGLGIPRVGTVYGVPVFSTSAVSNGREVASTAWSSDGTDITITVPTSCAIVPGMKILWSTATSTHDVVTSTAVDTATTTTIVLPDPLASSGSATEAGTITIQASENILVDINNTYVAQQELPTVEVVKLSDQTGSSLQVSAIWGRVARAGYANILCSPKSAA